MIFPNLVIKQYSNQRLKFVNVETRDNYFVSHDLIIELNLISKINTLSECSPKQLLTIQTLNEYLGIKCLDGLCDLKIINGNLDNLNVDLTNACNLRCKHCCFFKDGMSNSKSEIDFELLKNAINEAENLGLYRLKLSGGEPLTYYKITELLQLVNEKKFFTKIMTNGLLLPNFIDKLNNQKISFIISLDGFKKNHDYLRGEGNFEKTIKNIKIAIEAGFDIEINTALYDDNIKEIDNFSLFVKELGASKLNTQIIRPFGIAKKELLDKLTFLKDDDFLRKIHWRDLKWEKTRISNKLPFCDFCKSGLLIDYKADVFGCIYITEEPTGNLNEMSLNEIFDKGLKQNLLFNLPNTIECFSCELFNNLCAGGCRARAKKVTGSIENCDYWIPYLLNHTKFNNCQYQAYDFLTF